MNKTRKLLDELVSGKITIEEVEKQLKSLNLDRIGEIALIDVDRGSRSGIPEVVFGESKDASDIVEIVKGMLATQDVVLITRMDKEKVETIKKRFKEENIECYGKSPIISALVSKNNWNKNNSEGEGRIAVITAGTSDIPYAQEAEALARMIGVEVFSYYDVGVSGIHRLIVPMKEIVKYDVDAIIVFAGMEGALPTVVAALVDIPVIGVPVPTGYGYGGKGETALASMLQSCSPGLAVVNIGNGLGAASVASLIAKRASKLRK